MLSSRGKYFYHYAKEDKAMHIKKHSNFEHLLSILLLLLVFSLGYASPPKINWNKIERGVLYSRIVTNELEKGKQAVVHVYNIDKTRYAFRLLHWKDYSTQGPLSFDQWYQQTNAPVLFNVCPDPMKNAPTGYFRASGKTYKKQTHEPWKGLLVTGQGGRSETITRVIDMDFNSFDPEKAMDMDILQQPMLLDKNKQIRVKPRKYRATRVALGEDKHRNVLIFLTENPCTLYELAQWLKNGPFDLERAINLGGGNSDQVLGRYAPQRIYITGNPSKKPGDLKKGNNLKKFSSEKNLSFVMGLTPID